MVLRKPYAILIKHFKLIHLILTFLMAYTTLKMRALYKFFVSYISSGWLSINLEEVSEYVNATCYISSILIVIILFIVFWLMRFKKKPNLYYKIAMPVYIFSFAVFIFMSHVLNGAIAELISPLNLRIYRDVTQILFLVQAVLLIVPILRGIGFDVKKFNFKKDIADLQIEDLDSEEIEVNINIDKHKIKRRLNKFGRTSSYIFLRNKLIIYRVLLIAFIVMFGYFLVNVFITNKIYKEGQVVKLDNYSFKVNYSYLTKYNSNNSIISSDYKYIVVNFTPINRIEGNTFNLDKIDLVINGNYYYPEVTYYNYFKDLGVGYDNQALSIKNDLDYIMAFRIPASVKVNRAILRYITGTKQKDDNIIKIYKNVKLKLKDDTKNVLSINSKVGNNININSNIFKIDKYELANKFTYTYKNCVDDVCEDVNRDINVANYGYLIMKLTGEFKLENKGIKQYYNSYNDYYQPMIYIQYKIGDDIKKISNVDAVTPTKILDNNKEIYIEVPQEINDASEINFHLKSRNSDYIIKLK